MVLIVGSSKRSSSLRSIPPWSFAARARFCCQSMRRSRGGFGPEATTQRTSVPTRRHALRPFPPSSTATLPSRLLAPGSPCSGAPVARRPGSSPGAPARRARGAGQHRRLPIGARLPGGRAMRACPGAGQARAGFVDGQIRQRPATSSPDDRPTSSPHFRMSRASGYHRGTASRPSHSPKGFRKRAGPEPGSFALSASFTERRSRLMLSLALKGLSVSAVVMPTIGA